jgi:carboxylate-amine ligase
MVMVMPRRGDAGRGVTAPGSPSGAVCAADGITLGVEEEFVLPDPATRAAVLAAPDLVRMLDRGAGGAARADEIPGGDRDPGVHQLDGLGRELTRLQWLAAEAAVRLGCCLMASGVAPFGVPGLAAVTDQPRYQELARRSGPLVAEAGTCGCHVHVGVPSRDLGVQVLARLRRPRRSPQPWDAAA